MNRLPSGRNVRFFGVVLAALACSIIRAAEPPTQPARSQTYWKCMKEDPSLIRLYRLDEPSGFSFRNEAGQFEATMAFTTCSPYGNSRDKRWVHNLYSTFYPNPERTPGRWPGKMAVTPGVAFRERNPSRNVTRTKFGGTPDGIFTLAAWIRLQRQGTCSLFNIDGGMRLENFNGHLVLRYARGSARTAEPVFDDKVWHHLAMQWDGRSLRLFLDGEIVGESAFAGPPPTLAKMLDNPHAVNQPDELTGGLNIGGHLRDPKQDPVPFDLDELAIFSRALSLQEIREGWMAGKPELDAAAQKKAFQDLDRAGQIRRAIRMDIPKETMGYFQLGQEIPATIVIDRDAGMSGEFRAHVLLRDEANRVFADESRLLTVTENQSVAATVALRPNACGVYYLDMWVTDALGRVIARLPEEYGIGVTVALPPLKEIPLTSPFAVHHCYEGRFLGARLHREIFWPSPVKDRKERPFAVDYDAMADKANLWVQEDSGCKLLYTIYARVFGERVPGTKAQVKDMTRWSNYCRELVRRFKHKVYAWEIGNEPNAGGLAKGFSPEEYVLFLKLAYEAIKAEDPDAIVVGLSGCPGYLYWNERVFKAGGAKYFDVLSVHDYGSDPIYQYHQYQRISKVKEQLKKYRGELVPIWNSETGWAHAARDRNRPLTREELVLKAGDRLRYGENGEPYYWAFLPTTTESNAAAMQVQSMLMNLGAGCSKYFKIMSPSDFTPAYNASNGQPTLMGVSLAAASKALMHSVATEFMPMSSNRDAGLIIRQKDGTRTLALFSDDTPTLFFNCDRVGILRGMDMAGNPLSWMVGPEKTLTLRIGTAPIYLVDIPESFVQLPVASVSELPKTMPKEGVMTGTVKIRNPYGRNLSLSLSALVPPTSEFNIKPIVTLTPGATAEVPFTFTARQLERRYYTIALSVKEGDQLLGKLTHHFHSLGALRSVPVLGSEAALGDNAWWTALSPLSRDAEDRVIRGKMIPGVPWKPHWHGPHDLSFTVSQAWVKEKGLFVRIEVTDDVFLPAPPEEKHSFKYDCLELFFDGRLLSGNRWDSKLKTEQMVVTPNAGKEASPCRFWFGSQTPTVNARFISGRTEKGYWIEGMIAPKPGFEKLHPRGPQYGLEIMIDDADQPDQLRKVIMSMHRDNSRADWNHWGRYRLDIKSLKQP